MNYEVVLKCFARTHFSVVVLYVCMFTVHTRLCAYFLWVHIDTFKWCCPAHRVTKGAKCRYPMLESTNIVYFRTNVYFQNTDTPSHHAIMVTSLATEETAKVSYSDPTFTAKASICLNSIAAVEEVFGICDSGT